MPHVVVSYPEDRDEQSRIMDISSERHLRSDLQRKLSKACKVKLKGW